MYLQKISENDKKCIQKFILYSFSFKDYNNTNYHTNFIQKSQNFLHNRIFYYGYYLENIQHWVKDKYLCENCILSYIFQYSIKKSNIFIHYSICKSLIFLLSLLSMYYVHISKFISLVTYYLMLEN